MNIPETKRCNIRNKSGSITVETAIIIPFVILLLIMQIKIAQLVCAQNALENALYETAEIMSDYAVLYHEYGVGTIENKAMDKIGSLIGNNIINRIFDLRSCAETGDNILYTKVAEEICKSVLSKDKLVKCGFITYENLSFDGSTFFDDDEIIELHAGCKIFGKVNIGSSVRVRAWIRGDNPIGSINASDSVWKLNNFARGKIIRTVFGANLPYDYPVIASFEDGKAVMIKSLDHTKKTYLSGTELEKEVKSMIDKLYDFNETVNDSEIKTKKLLLVMPSNELNDAQSSVLLKMASYAGAKCITLEIVLFQIA